MARSRQAEERWFERLHHLGGKVSDHVAQVAGHSAVQLLVLVACLIWLAAGGSFDLLSDVLAVGAFALTQMVLNQQRRREAALHLKLDELILAVGGTRDEIAGAEQRSEAELRTLAERRSD